MYVVLGFRVYFSMAKGQTLLDVMIRLKPSLVLRYLLILSILHVTMLP